MTFRGMFMIFSGASTGATISAIVFKNPDALVIAVCGATLALLAIGWALMRAGKDK